MAGLILLVFLGILVAYFWTRMRGKMKLNITAKNWIGPVIVVVVVLALLFGSHSGGH
jgi:phosphatidylglycerophosphate synthase